MEKVSFTISAFGGTFIQFVDILFAAKNLTCCQYYLSTRPFVMDLKITAEFPYLSCWNNGTIWKGLLSIESTLMRIIIEAPNYPKAEDVQVFGDSDLQSFMHCLQPEDLKTDNLDLLEFLKAFHDAIQRNFVNDHHSAQIVSPGYCAEILKELELVGFSNIQSVSEDMKTVSIAHKDSIGRLHTMRVIIPAKYPGHELTIDVQLPVSSDELQWPNKISDTYTIFTNLVETFIPFWEEMNALDDQANIIDPPTPHFGHSHRRILMPNKLIMNITFDARRPRGLPEINFSGPEKLIDAYEKLIDDNFREWDESRTVLENLEAVFECQFEKPMEDNVSQSQTENENICIVCYAYDLENEIPDVICDCGAMFHPKCIYELFVNDCSNKAMRRCVDCPVCSEEIKVTSTTAMGRW